MLAEKRHDSRNRPRRSNCWKQANLFGTMLILSSSCRPLTKQPQPVPRTSETAICTAMPVRCSGNRFFLIVPGKRPLRLYLDSAGNEVLFRDVVTARKLPVIQEGKMTLTRVSFGPLPAPRARRGRLLVFKRFRAPAFEEEHADGVLGPNWFAGRRWRMDLARCKLDLCSHLPRIRGSVVPMELSKAGFATVQIAVAGESTTVLVDTGAHTRVTDALRRATPGPAIRPISFLGGHRFDEWHRSHPGWPYVPAGEAHTHAPMLKVPSVRLGGVDLGPVWFVRRAPANFRFMSKWTVRPVHGALGNNALAGRTLLLDFRTPKFTLGRRP